MPETSRTRTEDRGRGDEDDMDGPDIPDRRNLISVAVFLVGVVLLLPWNMTTTVSGYWDFKFRNVTPVDEYSQGVLIDCSGPFMCTEYNGNDDGQTTTELQKMFYSYLSIAMTVPNAVTIMLHAVFGHMVGMRLRIFGTKVQCKGLLSNCSIKLNVPGFPSAHGPGLEMMVWGIPVAGWLLL